MERDTVAGPRVMTDDVIYNHQQTDKSRTESASGRVADACITASDTGNAQPDSPMQLIMMVCLFVWCLTAVSAQIGYRAITVG